MEISGKSLFSAVIKKWWLLLIMLIIGCVFGLFWGAIFTFDEYLSEAKIYVTLKNQGTDNTQNGSITTTRIQECVTVLSDDYFLRQQYETSGIKNITSEMINKNVRFTVSGNFIVIQVSAGNAEEANQIAGLVATNAKTQILSSSLSETVSDVKLEGKASMPDSVKDKKIFSKLAISGLIAIGVTAIILILIRLNDKRLYHLTELTQNYNIPILGIIPDDEF